MEVKTGQDFSKTLIERILLTENIDFLIFIGIKNYSEIVDSFKEFPKMVFTEETFQINYPLVFSHSSRTLTVVFPEGLGNIRTIIGRLLKFNEQSKFLALTQSTNVQIETLQIFQEIKLLNTLSNYNKSVKTLDPFLLKIMEIKITDKLYQSKTGNVNLHPITVSVTNLPPRSLKVNDSVYIGTLVDLLRTFTYHINGSFEPAFKPTSQGVMEELREGKYDFVCYLEYYLTSNSSADFINNKNTSTILDVVDVIIIVPIPKKLHQKYYFAKPFDLWTMLAILILIIVSSSVITIANRSINIEKYDFGYNFGNMLRSIIAQAYPTYEFRILKSWGFVCMLVVFLGFILNIWYGAQLGSFITTFLWEKPMETVQDIQKQKLKVLVPKEEEHYLEFLPDIESYIDIFKLTPALLYFTNKMNLNDKFGYAELSDNWEHFVIPEMIYFQKLKFRKIKFSLSRIAIYLNINHDSFYKTEINRFISRIKDIGLYQFWSRKYFYEILKYKKLPTRKPLSEKNREIPLKLDFYVYSFEIFGTFLLLSLIIFILELIFNCYNKYVEREIVELVGYFYIE